jgi:acetyl-CoA acyltransferase 2
MSAATRNIFIVGAKRTPFGTFGGKLKALSATDLAVHSSKAALAAAKIDPSAIDEVFVGNVIQSSSDAAYLARHVGLRCGVGLDKSALTINRLCGSGFEAAILGAEAIILGRANIVLSAGAENMSQAPLQANGINVRWGVQLGKGLHLEDALWSGLTDSFAQMPMGVTAENLAAKYQVTREQCDEYSARSQHAWKAAHDAGIFSGKHQHICDYVVHLAQLISSLS